MGITGRARRTPRSTSARRLTVAGLACLAGGTGAGLAAGGATAAGTATVIGTSPATGTLTGTSSTIVNDGTTTTILGTQTSPPPEPPPTDTVTQPATVIGGTTLPTDFPRHMAFPVETVVKLTRTAAGVTLTVRCEVADGDPGCRSAALTLTGPLGTLRRATGDAPLTVHVTRAGHYSAATYSTDEGANRSPELSQGFTLSPSGALKVFAPRTVARGTIHTLVTEILGLYDHLYINEYTKYLWFLQVPPPGIHPATISLSIEGDAVTGPCPVWCRWTVPPK